MFLLQDWADGKAFIKEDRIWSVDFVILSPYQRHWDCVLYVRYNLFLQVHTFLHDCAVHTPSSGDNGFVPPDICILTGNTPVYTAFWSNGSAFAAGRT